MIDAKKSFYNEIWKEVKFEGDYTNKFGLQVSNYGRVRSIDFLTGEPVKILSGSRQEGYVIIRKKLFLPQPEAAKKRLDALRKERDKQTSALPALRGKAYTEAAKALKDLKRKCSYAMNREVKKRTINIGVLVHRLVAEFWCKKSSDKQTLVLHKDFNKLNNYHTNLQWATMDDNIAHQQTNPNVIAEKIRRKNGTTNSGNRKLTETRVMLIKKRLREGRTMRQLAKQFKVTETQIARIKKGENWANVPAAS